MMHKVKLSVQFCKDNSCRQNYLFLAAFCHPQLFTGQRDKTPRTILIKGWYKTMKRIYALALSAVMTLSLVACSSAKASNNVTDPNNEPVEISEGMSGGWAHSVDPAITDEQRDVFNKALDGLAGVNYEPIVYLGSQMVAGTNHCFLCQATGVYPGAEPHYVLMYIYEDLSGSAQIMNIADLDIGSFCEYGGIEY